MHDPWIWGAFVGFIVAMLAVDLLVFHREAHEVSLREAGIWSAVWIGLALAFGAVVWLWRGPEAGGQYLAGYLIEKSLSVDNIFVFAVIFGAFAVPARYQHRVLFWGVLGALVFRGVFIGVGGVMLERFHWLLYVFGAILLFTAVRMARPHEHTADPARNAVLRLIRRALPMTETYEGQRFAVRRDGRWLITPLLASLVVVETTDIVFAADSIPAIFAVTDDTFLVFASNAFAILGLRALYFLLAGMIGRFRYLKLGLATVLGFVGAKMLLSGVVHVPIWVSLAVIVAILGTSVAASLRGSSSVERERMDAP